MLEEPVVLMIIINAAGSIWIYKDVEVDKDICGTTPLSPFSPLLTSHSSYLDTINHVNTLITKHISVIMSYLLLQ